MGFADPLFIAAAFALCMSNPQDTSVKKKKKVAAHQRATYAQRLEGILSSAKPTKKKAAWISPYPVRKNMILFETLNNIHALFTAPKKN